VSPGNTYVQAVGYSETGQPLQYTMLTDTSTLDGPGDRQLQAWQRANRQKSLAYQGR